jgi:hypothetical protein
MKSHRTPSTVPTPSERMIAELHARSRSKMVAIAVQVHVSPRSKFPLEP